jgi:RNA polymerase sigma factor (sigma-70 family)
METLRRLRVTMITKQREYELIRAAQSGDTSARDELIASHNGFVWKRALAWRKNLLGHDEEDLRQQIWLHLVDAVEKFDLQSGKRFLTYAGFHILRAMNACQLNNRVVRFPRDYRNDSKYGVTICHLCVDVPNDRPQTPVHTLTHLRDFVLDAESKELQKKLKGRLRRLAPRQRYALVEHAKGRTLREISKDLGVSHERARQLEAKAFEKLKNLFEESTSEGNRKC